MTSYEAPSSTFQTVPPNIASQLPSVNLGFDELKDRISKFTVAFDEFIDKRRAQMEADKNAYIKDIADLKESQKAHKRNIDYYKQKESELAADGEKEAQEIADIEREIGVMSSQKATKETSREALNAQIAIVQHAIENKRSKLAKEKSELAAQATHNQPELAFWEDHLGLRIEGAGKSDHIRFVFTCLDQIELDREFELVLSMEQREYEVVGTRPKLPKDVLEGCVERLNDTRKVPGFLKEIRENFVKHCVQR